MTTERSKSDNSAIEGAALDISTRLSRIWAVGLNIGLALIAISLSWDFFLGMPATIFAERLWSSLFYGGLGIAGFTWTISSSFTHWQKIVIVCGILAGTTYEEVNSAREFDKDRRVLQAGRVERVRFVHDGLGLSFRIAPNSRILSDVTVVNAYTGAPLSSTGLRPRFGEEVTLFRMATPEDPTGESSPIRMRATPFRFSRLDAVVQRVLSDQNAFASQPGERLIRPLHLYRHGKHDIIEFELMHDQQHVLSRYVFMRSGSYLVSFVLRSPNEKDRLFFDQFVQSIQITGRATQFNI